MLWCGLLQIREWLAGWLQVRPESPAEYGAVAVLENGPVDASSDAMVMSAGDGATESLLAATEPISSSSTQGAPPAPLVAPDAQGMTPAAPTAAGGGGDDEARAPPPLPRNHRMPSHTFLFICRAHNRMLLLCVTVVQHAAHAVDPQSRVHAIGGLQFLIRCPHMQWPAPSRAHPPYPLLSCFAAQLCQTVEPHPPSPCLALL